MVLKTFSKSEVDHLRYSKCFLWKENLERKDKTKKKDIGNLICPQKKYVVSKLTAFIFVDNKEIKKSKLEKVLKISEQHYVSYNGNKQIKVCFENY